MMSIQVPISQSSYRKLRRMLKSGKEVVCLDNDSYLRTILVAQKLLSEGVLVDPKNVRMADPAIINNPIPHAMAQAV